jgi:flagellar basal body-associated protein FliL
MSEPEKNLKAGKKGRHKVRKIIVLVIVLALVGGIAFLVIRKLRRDNTVTYDAYTTSQTHWKRSENDSDLTDNAIYPM